MTPQRASPLTTAVVLAAGRGSRMRADAGGTALEPAQQEAAGHGLKALIPFHGRAYIDYLLTAIADAGFTDVCVVVRPGVDPVRAHCKALSPRRFGFRFAAQPEPLGSAHALLAAETLTGGADFAVINADNIYSVEALATLHTLGGAGLVAFRRAGLLRGNITPDRLHGYALVTTTAAGALDRIVEKPSPAELAGAAEHALFSMTCWRFDASIFDACRVIPRSPRGEYELPDAVRHALRCHHEFGVVEVDAPVLDLSRRDDVPRVAELLRGRRVEL